MKNEFLKRALIAVGLILIVCSCDNEENSSIELQKTNLTGKSLLGSFFNGPTVPVGNGFASSWIQFDANNIPHEIGVEISPEVFNNLPSDSDFLKTIYIPLPKNATETTAFNHIGIKWNPERFSTIVGLKEAHFNINFFLITPKERLEIPNWTLETEAKFSLYPPKNYMPSDYAPIINGSGSFATIGRYWRAKNKINRNISNFEMLLATYNGSFVGIAPTVTLNFLKSKSTVHELFSQSIENPLNNRLPREYNIYLNKKGNYCVSLSNFIRR